MKSILYATGFCMLLLAACNSSKNKSAQTTDESKKEERTTTEIKGQNITSGYFVKNTVVLSENVNLFILKDQAQFDELLGVGKTMTNEIIVPDFETQTIVAVAIQTTNLTTQLNVDKIELDGSKLNFYLHMNQGEAQSFSATPLILYTFPKQETSESLVLFLNNTRNKSELIK